MSTDAGKTGWRGRKLLNYKVLELRPCWPSFLPALLAMSLCAAASAGGVTAGAQKAWSTKGDSYVITAGYMQKSERRDWEYYEGGAVVLPGSRSGTMVSDGGRYSREYQNSAYGVYGGYYVYLMPILRPGVLVGTAIRDNAVYGSLDGKSYSLRSYSDFKLDYYVAFSVQLGMVSLVVSNYGFGGGLNYMF